ncbi:twitching motility protein [Leptothrix cholodnii SP-6]|uniref:Twitching motility protein n=1 Tax=Leptothrix cholodnii (strain ATCC 51168 / LMG 8142 / SP-6) TaxID=395495 RepID=B1Y6E6_LEPCP|nr:PilT/PilU family type 4a pilus ATPase [Leptothrix cholodnii]ACB34782.1 twitching motility protein [Leptothrix cholodnii SP-6]
MTKNLERILRLMAEKRASDVFLSANMPVLIKIHGQIMQLTQDQLAPNQTRQLLAEMLTHTQLEDLDETGELNVGLQLPGVGSFRLSAFKQRGTIAAVFRCMPTEVPTIESLNLPDSLPAIALARRGLVLMVGATGSGKSTTLASMIQQRNRTVAGHILTIEDPIEFLFTNYKSVVNQREVGRDVQSLQIGLKNAMRQAPDCIFIGEIRDRETMSAALSYALSGHLVLSTLHANNSHHALNRILSFYTPEARPALMSDLASGLKAIVSQRLLRSTRGGRIPACEVLLNTQLIAELIDQGNFGGVKEAMERSIAEGSQTFEQDLARLISEGLVTREEGLSHSDSPTNLLWRLQNEAHGGKRQPEPEPEAEPGPSFTEITLDVHSAQANRGRRNPLLRPLPTNTKSN